MAFTCLLIGQDNLLIQCGKFLLERNHQIKWVVSSVQSIQIWCNENNISYVNSLEELPETREASVDYLFSIVNGIILTKEDLKIPRYAAINYHDSLLPKYAGVNATTWSLLEGETNHGITWHIIDERIDMGGILYQNKFAMAENETVLTLNFRCFEEAVKGFIDIITRIETSTLSIKLQELELRSYFSLSHVLPDLGFINWKLADATSIPQMHRALHFGNYSNNVGVLNIDLENTFLIVEDVVQANFSSNVEENGKVLSIGKDGLVISTTTQPIIIKKLQTIDGKNLQLSELMTTFGITVNSQLPQLDELFVQNYKSLYKKALSREKYWLSQLTNIIEHSFFADRMFEENIEYQRLPAVTVSKLSLSSSKNPQVYLTILPTNLFIPH